MRGLAAWRIRLAASATTDGSAGARGMCHTRSRKNSTGKSWASAWTSVGRASVTAPVSAWSVSTRIASGAAQSNCSGRSIRSQYFDTGRKESFTDIAEVHGNSTCCSTGLGMREAGMSAGSRSTGSRLMVAPAAPVTRLVAPGPIEVTQAMVRSRLLILAKPAAAWTIACSFRPRMYRISSRYWWRA